MIRDDPGLPPRNQLQLVFPLSIRSTPRSPALSAMHFISDSTSQRSRESPLINTVRKSLFVTHLAHETITYFLRPSTLHPVSATQCAIANLMPSTRLCWSTYNTLSMRNFVLIQVTECALVATSQKKHEATVIAQCQSSIETASLTRAYDRKRPWLSKILRLSFDSPDEAERARHRLRRPSLSVLSINPAPEAKQQLRYDKAVGAGENPSTSDRANKCSPRASLGRATSSRRAIVDFVKPVHSTSCP